MSYDEKCYELAQYFLPKGSTEELNFLATDIQDAVERWLNTWADLEYGHECPRCHSLFNQHKQGCIRREAPPIP